MRNKLEILNELIESLEDEIASEEVYPLMESVRRTNKLRDDLLPSEATLADTLLYEIQSSGALSYKALRYIGAMLIAKTLN